MTIRRVLVGAVASLAWPSVLLAAPLGITFFAARVFAEAAAAPDNCDGGSVVACADAGVNARCSSAATGCTGDRCACVRASCRDNGPTGTLRDTLACKQVYTCPDYAPHIAACTGKTKGTLCTIAGSTEVGECVADQCYQLDGGAFTLRSDLFCLNQGLVDAGKGSNNGGGGGGGPSGGPIGDPGDKVPGSSSSSSGAAPPADDSSCEAAPGSATGKAALLVAPLAIGLLLARRRRGRTKR